MMTIYCKALRKTFVLGNKLIYNDINITINNYMYIIIIIISS